MVWLRIGRQPSVVYFSHDLSQLSCSQMHTERRGLVAAITVKHTRPRFQLPVPLQPTQSDNPMEAIKK